MPITLSAIVTVAVDRNGQPSKVDRGFRVRVQALGTTGVPLAIEIGFREDGQLDACEPVRGSPGSFLLARGTGRNPLLRRAGNSKSP